MIHQRLLADSLLLALRMLALTASLLIGQTKSNLIPFTKSTHHSTNKQVNAALNSNQWNYWVQWDGQSGRNPYSGDAGGLYPKGNVGAIFADGIIWGGYVQDSTSSRPLRVGGSTYVSAQDPGHILAGGIPANPSDSDVKIYRLRSDYAYASDEVLRNDAAQTFQTPISQITGAYVLELRNRYRTDWENWPVHLGAPYVDTNMNGSWDPGVDTPGMPNALQTIWFVTNDFDVTTIPRDFSGSPGIGLEIQHTLWTEKIPGLENVIFRRARMINKSAFDVHEMYIGIWADTDLGDFGDDFVGCDSSLSLAYTYNGNDVDSEFAANFLKPPAIGHLLLQGPRVDAPGQRAIFDFRDVADMQNLPPSSFVWFAAGTPVQCDGYEYGWSIATYNILNGFDKKQFRLEDPRPMFVGSGPLQGQVTKWPLNGDPLLDPFGFISDIDGQGSNFPPGDRRYFLSSGPFTLASSDTQEIVLAILGGNDQVNGRFGALENLKHLAANLQQTYRDLNAFPYVNIDKQSDAEETTLRIVLDLRDSYEALSASFEVTPVSGNLSSIRVDLFDDGMHDDSLAGDGIWGSREIRLSNRRYPHEVSLLLDSNQGSKQFDNIQEMLSLRPTPELINFRQVWENGRQDGQLNHGETAHIAFDMLHNDYVNRIEKLSINGVEIKDISFRPLNILQSDEFKLVVEAPENVDSLTFLYSVEYDQFLTIGSITLPVHPWTPTALWRDMLEVFSVRANDKHAVALIADALQITGDIYQIDFGTGIADSQTVWHLTNLSSGELLLQNQIPGTDQNVSFPVVDGVQFRVSQPPFAVKHFQTVSNAVGIIDPPVQGTFIFNDNGFPTHDGQSIIRGVNDRPDATRQQTNGSTWGVHTGGSDRFLYETYLARVFSGDNLDRALSYDFELRFTEAGGYAAWAFESGEIGEVPFELWNIGINTPDDPTDDYRMIPWVRNDEDFATGPEVFNINALDHAVSGSDNDPYTDWIYWHDPEDKSPGESGYQQFVADMQAGIYQFESLEVMARTVLVNWNGGAVSDPAFPENLDAALPEPGTVFRIIMHKPHWPGDRLLVDTAPAYQPELFYPKSFSLLQNYPNPFNPETTIEFAIPGVATVKLEIFNMLGQRIRTLVDESLEPAEYRVLWDGSTGTGAQVASGIYFYRLSAGRFVKTRKMILLR